MSTFLSVLRSIVVGVLAAIVIEIVALQPFRVSGESMQPNFFNNERVIIDKITPKFTGYTRGEVVVFLLANPENGVEHLIKRIIALPGERILIIDRTIIIYNKAHPDGMRLDESRYRPRINRDIPINVQLSDDEYFVMGDNRPVSKDSEIFGPISTRSIVGRVLVRYFPFDKIGAVR
ncbi:signal peptidase I [Candidatus Uhrbacteria bacterium]|nr:signal peptidase I [Candidatus Uhrbacteria bacterium]